MNYNFFNNKIVILNDYAKNSFIQKINTILNVKIITLSEIKKYYCYDYTNEAIYFISKKYNVIPNIANTYIENTYYVNDNNENKNEKIVFINNIKKDLIENNLLAEDKMFVKYLRNKDIVLYNLKHCDKFYKNIFNELSNYNNITSYDDEIGNNVACLYECNNSEEEIAFVCDKICQLINSGVNINNIKLSNVTSEYEFVIKKMFRIFNIPINIPSFRNVKSSITIKKFKESYIDDLEKALSNITDKYLYNNVVNIINEFSWADNISDVKYMIDQEIDNIKQKSVKLKNAVEVIDFQKEVIDENDFVFLINFNEGVIPINYKDEDYFNDKEKNILGINTSFEKNNNEINRVKDTIVSVKNLFCTYSSYNLSNELFISSCYDSELFEEKQAVISFNSSNSYNKIVLTSLKDDNRKYNVKSDDLLLLDSFYNDFKYLNYNNEFKQLNKQNVNNFYKDGLVLSYTSMDSFYKCSFRYYLDYVLKLNKFENTYKTVIGNIFHNILSVVFTNDINIDQMYDKLVLESDYEFTNSEKYFTNKLKEELKIIINVIKNQINYTQLNKIMCEKEIIVNIDEARNVKFKGFIDKILYNDFNNKTIVCIVDYKTGNPTLNINNSIYGLNMQLPVYIYLIKNEIKDVIVGGFYLQKLLSNNIDKSKREDDLKLLGYTNIDENIMALVDSSYDNSKIIKGLKTKEDGFYEYSKTITNSKTDILYNVVENKIKQATEDILNGKYDINPKQINNKNVGCEYCKYRDICFVKQNQFAKLKEVKDIFSEVYDE